MSTTCFISALPFRYSPPTPAKPVCTLLPQRQSLPFHPRRYRPSPSISLSLRQSHHPPQALLPRSKIPMYLTWARVLAIPLLCLTTLLPSLSVHPWLSALLFALASFTDFLDGYLARLWHVESQLGIFLDPVADKLLVAVALTLLVARLNTPSLSLAAAVILAREIFVSALREWMAKLGLSVVVKVSIWGKIKTATQMLALTLLLLAPHPATLSAKIGIPLACLSAALAVLSATEYVIAALRSYDNGATKSSKPS